MNKIKKNPNWNRKLSTLLPVENWEGFEPTEKIAPKKECLKIFKPFSIIVLPINGPEVLTRWSGIGWETYSKATLDLDYGDEVEIDEFRAYGCLEKLDEYVDDDPSIKTIDRIIDKIKSRLHTKHNKHNKKP